MLVISDNVEKVFLCINDTTSTYTDTMKDKNSTLWIKAMDDELKSLESLTTWKVVDP